jgi:beta-xylosidase
MLARRDRRGPLALVVAVAALALFTTAAATPAGPSLPHDFADPTILVVGRTFYAYSTARRYDSRVVHVPVTSSTSPTGGWGRVRDAMPELPSWVVRSPAGAASVWAPSVARRRRGDYLLYFTAFSARRDAQCVGVARSGSPIGPFHSVSSRPLICHRGDFDAIDPKPFSEHGRHYLLYSAGSGGNDTIWLQRVNAEGTRTIGPRRALVWANRPDEAHIVEAPTLIRHGDRYVLFYSGNAYNSGAYFINYATSSRLDGTYVKHPGQFLNKHTLGDGYQNPGGQDVFRADCHDFLVFHAYTDPTTRAMFVAGLSWTTRNAPALRGHALARTHLDGR